MKVVAVMVTALLIFVSPGQTFSQTVACDKDGLTIIYVNGIWTDEDNGLNQLNALQNNFDSLSRMKDVEIKPAYNSTHLGGGGDIAKSLLQAYTQNLLIKDSDTLRMLRDIRRDLSSRRVLLVGHSQGSFYTSQLYNHLIDLGVPVEAINTYNIAMPLSRQWKGNMYITSSNDTVINAVRFWARTGGAYEPAPANVALPVREGSNGHSLADNYLFYASQRIIGEIDRELIKLKATSSIDGPCFQEPKITLVDLLAAVLLDTGDIAIRGIWGTTKVAADFGKGFANLTLSLVGNGARLLGDLSIRPLVLESPPAPAILIVEPKKVEATVRTQNSLPPKKSVPAPVAAVVPVLPVAAQPENISSSTAASSTLNLEQNFAIPMNPIALSVSPGFGGGGGRPPAPVVDPTPAPPAPEPVYIPEIYTSEIHVAQNYIELFNASSSDISLENIVIDIDGRLFPQIGTIVAGQYLLLEDPVFSLSSFSSLSLVMVADGATTTIETVTRSLLPAATKTRYSITGGDEVASVSFEREGITNVWHQNDFYSTGSIGGNTVYGTPGVANSAGLPEAGISCSGGSALAAGLGIVDFLPTATCTYYSSFLTTATPRYAMIFAGTPSNATSVVREDDLGTGDIVSGYSGIPIAETHPDTEHFTVIFEMRAGLNDNGEMYEYFTGVDASPPHNNYRVITWKYVGPYIPPPFSPF